MQEISGIRINPVDGAAHVRTVDEQHVVRLGMKPPILNGIFRKCLWLYADDNSVTRRLFLHNRRRNRMACRHLDIFRQILRRQFQWLRSIGGYDDLQ